MPTEDTNIGWTDDSWNPVHGCHKISEGCKNCYAAAFSQKMGHTDGPWTVENAEENVMLQDHLLDYPRNKDGRRIFVNSMSDLFNEQVPDEYIHEVMDVIEEADQHIYQVLTKHGADNGRLAEWSRWPDNLWMGVSVEKQTRAYRIDELEQTGAAVKWVSFEPLVGPVSVQLDGMDWIVIGGESGDNFREMDHRWARQLVSVARESDTPVYFKQSAAKSNETGRALAKPPHHDYWEAIEAEGEHAVDKIREFPDCYDA